MNRLSHAFLSDFVFVATLIFVHFWEEPLPPSRLTVYIPNHQVYNIYECGSKYPNYKGEKATQKMEIFNVNTKIH